MRTLLMRALLATMLCLVGFNASAQTAIAGNVTTQNLVAAGACTAGGCVEVDVKDKGAVTVQVTGTYTGALSGQVTTDGITWVTLGASGSFVALSNLAGSATISSGSTGIWQVAAIPGARRFRVAALAAVTGTARVSIQTSTSTPASSTTITGGGDASAANQVTANTSLASIDTKLSGLADATQKTQVVDGSGNVIASTSNALNVHLASGGATGVAQGSTTSGQTGSLTQAAAVSSPPTYSNGTTNPLTTDTSGNLRVNVVAGATGDAVSQGSTTSGQSGVLMQGAVTTGSPTYTTGQTSPLSMNTVGGLRVNPNFAGTPASTSTGATDSGTQRVISASDSPEVASLGGTSDAASSAGGAGSVNAKLRLVTTQLATLDTSLGTINTSINAANPQLPSSLGAQVAGSSLSVVQASSTQFSSNIAQLAGNTISSGNGTSGTGTLRVANVSDNSAVAAWGHGAIDSAVPANATYVGARSGANLVGLIQGSATAAISVSTATTTQLVALSGSTKIYVTSYSILAAGTGNIKFVYGTGSNCGTGTTDLSGNYNLTAQAGLAQGGGLGPVLVVPAGQALCVTTSAAVGMAGHVTYTQF